MDLDYELVQFMNFLTMANSLSKNIQVTVPHRATAPRPAGTGPPTDTVAEEAPTTPTGRRRATGLPRRGTGVTGAMAALPDPPEGSTLPNSNSSREAFHI